VGARLTATPRPASAARRAVDSRQGPAGRDGRAGLHRARARAAGPPGGAARPRYARCDAACDHRRTTPPILAITRIKRRQIHVPDRVDHEPRQMVLRQPLPQRRRHQQQLLTITLDEVLSHAQKLLKPAGQTQGLRNSLRQERRRRVVCSLIGPAVGPPWASGHVSNRAKDPLTAVTTRASAGPETAIFSRVLRASRSLDEEGHTGPERVFGDVSRRGAAARLCGSDGARSAYRGSPSSGISSQCPGPVSASQLAPSPALAGIAASCSSWLSLNWSDGAEVGASRWDA
jgi:hypothetical protein